MATSTCTDPRLPAPPEGCTRAPARTVGTHFAMNAPDGHECVATCYRIGADGSVSTLCDYGHMVRRHRGDSSWGGSAFHASLAALPVHAPFVLVSGPDAEGVGRS